MSTFLRFLGLVLLYLSYFILVYEKLAPIDGYITLITMTLIGMHIIGPTTNGTKAPPPSSNSTEDSTK